MLNFKNTIKNFFDLSSNDLRNIILLFWFSLLIYFLTLHSNLLPSICLFHKIFKIPCLTCGGTSALYSLINGNIIDSIRTNPLVSISIIILTLITITSFIDKLINPKRIISIRIKSKRNRLILANVLLISIIANWIYLIFNHK